MKSYQQVLNVCHLIIINSIMRLRNIKKRDLSGLTPSFAYNPKLISTALNKVINYNEIKWKKIYKHYSKQIMVYDKDNIMKLKSIRSKI